MLAHKINLKCRLIYVNLWKKAEKRKKSLRKKQKKKLRKKHVTVDSHLLALDFVRAVFCFYIIVQESEWRFAAVVLQTFPR